MIVYSLHVTIRCGMVGGQMIVHSLHVMIRCGMVGGQMIVYSLCRHFSSNVKCHAWGGEETEPRLLWSHENGSMFAFVSFSLCLC